MTRALRRAVMRQRRSLSGRRHIRRILVVLAILAVDLGCLRAHALAQVCPAAQIIAESCTPTQCTIAHVYDIGAGCDLDFGPRDVTIADNAELQIESTTLSAKSLTIAPKGDVTGDSNGRGGFFKAVTTGDIVLQRNGSSLGTISVKGDTHGGCIVLEAGGDIVIEGRLHARRSFNEADGGEVTLRAGGDILVAFKSEVDVSGGANDALGGSFDAVAMGHIQIADKIIGQGAYGGSVDIYAGESVTTTELGILDFDSLNGSGGDGGCPIAIVAGTTAEVNGTIRVKGSAQDGSGGAGGDVALAALFGDVILRGDILAKSGAPDGAGGPIEITAANSILIDAEIDAEGAGNDSCGGDITLTAGLDVAIGGRVSAAGGDLAEDVTIEAGRDVLIDGDAGGSVRANGTAPQGFGGDVTIQGGGATSGNVTIGGVIDVTGGDCDEFGCGRGGGLEASGCTVTVMAPIDAAATEGDGVAGDVFLTARDTLVIGDLIDASALDFSLSGLIEFTFPDNAAALDINVQPMPAAGENGLPLCEPGSGPVGCLLPCPTCGDGTTDFPEECDDEDTLGCDGCSRFCRAESNCDDQSPCTDDSCEPVLGCRHKPVTDEIACPDGTVCNGTERCVRGVCLPDPGSPPDCNDSNACTEDQCDPVGGCQHVDIACEDGDVCTTDGCSPGIGCTFTPIPECVTPTTTTTTLSSTTTLASTTTTVTTTTTLAPTSTTVVPTTTTSVAAPTSTTVTTTTATTTSIPTVMPPPECTADAECDDGNVCNGTETCSTRAGGTCLQGALVLCAADDNPCTDAQCDPLVGCVQRAHTAPCDDGDVCTVGDACVAGQCQSGVTTGAAGFECVSDKLTAPDVCESPLPKKLARGLGRQLRKANKAATKAERLVAQGAKTKKVATQMKKITKALRAIEKSIAKAEKSKKAKKGISAACAGTIRTYTQQQTTVATGLAS